MDGSLGRTAPRTAYTCIAHLRIYMCRKGKNSCWEEHLADISLDANLDDEEDCVPI